MIRTLICMTALLWSVTALAQDEKYIVDVLPDTEQGETVISLHSNIPQAVDRALPRLWERLLPAESIPLLPQNIQGIRFLQRAVPTADGVRVVFDEQRVGKFLSELQLQQEQGTESASVEAPQTEPAAITHTGLDLDLSVEHQATLAEQILFESDLRSDSRGASLTPYLLNENTRKYHLRLKVADDSWVPLWFARRGMAVTPLPEGWLAH